MADVSYTETGSSETEDISNLGTLQMWVMEWVSWKNQSTIGHHVGIAVMD